MDSIGSNKRFKAASGAPVSTSAAVSANRASPASRLPAYQPPAPPTRSSGPSSNSARAATTSTKNGIRLTVKAPPSKLRQATSGSNIPPDSYSNDNDLSESDATPAPATRTARSTRNPRTVVEADSDEEDEEDGLDLDDDEDALGDEEDEEDETMLDADEDAEGEDDEDMEEDEHPPPPIIKQQSRPGNAKPHVTVTAPREGPLKSVEAKETGDDEEEDEELSELDSNEDIDIDDNGGDEDEDDEPNSDSEDDDASRSATPDLTKLTKRQRAAYEEGEAANASDSGLLALSNEAQKKKHLTAEEHAVRRAEMARRRKNLSEKRNEEEKMDTINKLLKKPAPKRRSRAEMLAAASAHEGTPALDDGEGEMIEYEKPDPVFCRWSNNREGSRLGVPEEWIEAGLLGSMEFGGRSGAKMVQEVS